MKSLWSRGLSLGPIYSELVEFLLVLEAIGIHKSLVIIQEGQVNVDQDFNVFLRNFKSFT